MTSSFFTQIGNDFYGRAAGDILGTSVSLSSDGSVVAISSPQLNNIESGADGYVSIYKNVDNTWTQIGSDLDQLGDSVSLSSDGSVVAIGSRGGMGM